MKKITTYILSAVALVLLSGCSLDEKVVSNSTRETYYQNESQVRTGLNGCYLSARNIFANSGYWQMTECAADLIYLKDNNQYNATCNVSPSNPGVAPAVWQNSYSGIMICNEIIDAIETSTAFTDEQKLPWLAEAVVMRSLYYYILTSTFGDVPFYTEAVTEHNRAKIAGLPRMSADETRDYLIEELMDYLMPENEGGKAALPMVRTYAGGGKSYAGAAVGLMLAGKFCLWNERYDDAIKVFEQLQMIYGDYTDPDQGPSRFAADYPLSDVRFSEKFVKESILEVGNTAEEFGLIINGSVAPWCMPKREVVQISSNEPDSDEDSESESDEDVVEGEGDDGEDEEVETEDSSNASDDKLYDVYDGISIPELGGNARSYTAARPTSYFYTNLMPYHSDDLRNGEYSNGRGIDNLGVVRSSGNLAWRWTGTVQIEKTDPEDPTKKIKVWGDYGVYWFASMGTIQNSKDKPYGNKRPWLGNKFWCFGMNSKQDGNNYKIFRYAGVLLNLAEAYLMKPASDPAKACQYLNIVRGRAGLSPISLETVGGSTEALMEEIRMECARELFGEFQRKYDLVRWGIWYERTKMYNTEGYVQNNIQPYHEYWPIPAEQVTYSGNALDNNAYKEL